MYTPKSMLWYSQWWVFCGANHKWLKRCWKDTRGTHWLISRSRGIFWRNSFRLSCGAWPTLGPFSSVGWWVRGWMMNHLISYSVWGGWWIRWSWPLMINQLMTGTWLFDLYYVKVEPYHVHTGMGNSALEPLKTTTTSPKRVFSVRRKKVIL